MGASFHWIKHKTKWNAVETQSFCERKDSWCVSWKIMVFVFWDAEGVIHVEFMPSANTHAYCSFL
jgi:hypothetical protein